MIVADQYLADGPEVAFSSGHVDENTDEYSVVYRQEGVRDVCVSQVGRMDSHVAMSDVECEESTSLSSDGLSHDNQHAVYERLGSGVRVEHADAQVEVHLKSRIASESNDSA